MQEADILAETYWDTVTVYRPFKDTLPSGESVFKSGTEGKMMYQDVPCALSSHSGGALAQTLNQIINVLFIRRNRIGELFQFLPR